MRGEEPPFSDGAAARASASVLASTIPFAKGRAGEGLATRQEALSPDPSPVRGRGELRQPWGGDLLHRCCARLHPPLGKGEGRGGVCCVVGTRFYSRGWGWSRGKP